MKFTLPIIAAVFVAAPGYAQTNSPGSASSLNVSTARAAIDVTLDEDYPHLFELYKDIHQHPELAFQENRTAAVLAGEMRKLGFQVTEHVGKTGIVAIYKNGAGPTVLVRTELDALPLKEKTGLPYASEVQQTVDGKLTYVDHACGHDIHMAWWLGTAEALLAMKDKWHGTLMFVGQPAEEIISGAKAMLADGLFKRFPMPDYGFAAHVGPGPVGKVLIKEGIISSASDTIYITFHGIGVHGSMPDKGIDPIAEAAHFVTDVQTVISRKKNPQEFGVITVGSFNAGTVANIIPDHADLQLTLRSFSPDVRTLLKEGVATTAKASAMMAGAPEPDIKHMFGAAPVVNDIALSDTMSDVMKTVLGGDNVTLVPVYKPGGNASEDYSEFVTAGMTKSVYFGIGGNDPETIADYRAKGKPLPVNHSPYFAPAPDASIRTGVRVLTTAVLAVAGK